MSGDFYFMIEHEPIEIPVATVTVPRTKHKKNADNRPYPTCPMGMTKHSCSLNNLNKTQQKDSCGNVYLVPDIGVDPVSPTDICNWCKKQHTK